MPSESYRRTLVVRTADGCKATLIITRQPGHPDGPVWLSLGSTVATTIALADPDVAELTGLLTAASIGGAPAPAPSRAAVEAASAVVADLAAAMLQAAYDVDTSTPGRTKAPRPAGAERGA